jgi:hypothetical protein
MAYSNGNHREAVVRAGASMIRAISKYWWIFTALGFAIAQ